MDAHQAKLFFQLVSHLYTWTAMIVTTNVPFERWGTLFAGDEVTAAAILDRLLHHSHVFLVSGPNYRMKGKLPQRVGNPVDLPDDNGDPMEAGVGQI